MQTRSLSLCDVDDETTLDELLAVSQSNVDRWSQIAALHDEIKLYESRIESCQVKIKELKLEHVRATWHTKLMRKPPEWNCIGSCKSNVMAMLKSKLELPREFHTCEDMMKAMEDKEVYLAWLERSSRDSEELSFIQRVGLPESVRSDEEVKIKLVKRFPSFLEGDNVPEDMWDDPKVLFTYLESYEDSCFSSSVNKTLARFSPRLRADENIMLQVLVSILLKNEDPCSDMLVCEPTFATNDSPLLSSKAFCLRLAQEVQHMKVENSRLFCPILLRDLSFPLRCDEEVVLAFCRMNGRNLKYASPQLGISSTIVTVACQENPRAIFDALPCQALSELLLSKDFVLRAISDLALSPLDSRQLSFKWRLYHRLPFVMQQDREIAVAASAKCAIVIAEFTKTAWHHDREFWERVVHKCHGYFHTCWDHLPCYIQQDQLVALFVAQHAGKDDNILVSQIVREFPSILLDRQVVKNIVSNLHVRSWWSLFSKVPQSILDDEQFCIELLRINRLVYNHMPMHLRDRRNVVEAAVSQSSLSDPDDDEDSSSSDVDDGLVFFLPADIQVLYPDLVAAAIRNGIVLSHGDIAEDLFFNPDVATALMSTGNFEYDLGYLLEHFSDEKEVLLVAAEHYPDSFDSYCSDDLLRDKQFMLEVVKKNGSVLRCADRRIQFDFDLMLAAFVNRRDLAYIYTEAYDDEEVSEHITAFALQVRKRLQDYMSFTTLLQGISFVGSLRRHDCCHLSLLNQGSETATEYKRLIAQFGGVPLSDELRSLKRVAVDLTRWGF